LRFADDILLFANTRRQLKQMLADLVVATKRVGLIMHMGKTKIMNNIPSSGRKGPSSIKVDGKQIEVVPFEPTEKYLGRLFSFNDIHAAEM